jgi:hypothetical protein
MLLLGCGGGETTQEVYCYLNIGTHLRKNLDIGKQ